MKICYVWSSGLGFQRRDLRLGVMSCLCSLSVSWQKPQDSLPVTPKSPKRPILQGAAQFERLPEVPILTLVCRSLAQLGDIVL